ncbi:MAG: response regulator [Oculatellaceae cyanobacterium bins.114]|nr:response regulator [Oculatellaceae cyanobacterium bins.114]
MSKILVIEDERPVRTNIVDLLTVEGFEAIGAENGRAGLQLIQEQEPDLVICDVLMPKMDGFEVLRALGQRPDIESVPFIFLTAKTERSDMRQGMELGAYDYLTKPFTRTELLGAVHAQLKKRELMMQQYMTACEQSEQLEQRLHELQQFSDAKGQLLNNLIDELRNPLSNISLSIRMLKEGTPGANRDRYLKILQEEFSREIALLNQVSELQQLLTPANIKLLRQFNLLQGKSEG